MPRKARKILRPTALAMVICDAVLRDGSSKKPTLVGLFNQVTAPVLPAMHPRMHVFLSLTNGHGRQPFLLECKAPDNRTVFETRGEVEFGRPVDVQDLNIELRGLVFEQQGTYLFRFSCGGEFVASRGFTVAPEDKP
jgi:hypothetical protein